MKLRQLSLAIIAFSPLVFLHAGIIVTPVMVGQTFQDTQANNGKGHLLETDQGHLKDDVFLGASLGVELTPWLSFEAEYTHLKGDIKTVSSSDAEYTQQQINGNFLVSSDLITKNYDSKIKPYVLLGAGHYKYKFEGNDILTSGLKAQEGTLGNAGLGIMWRFNDLIALRTETRATYNIDEDFWNYTAFAGLNVVVGGHLKPKAEVQTQENQSLTITQPVVKKVVNLTEPLDMELRVFFDVNKSNVKPQYQSEIAKVAEKLNEFTNATARISGHTDNTGPRKLNERLSLARANAVKAVLVNEYNIDSSRMTTEGFAWDQPIADNQTKEGRAMNRRVFAQINGSKLVQKYQ